MQKMHKHTLQIRKLNAKNSRTYMYRNPHIKCKKCTNIYFKSGKHYFSRIYLTYPNVLEAQMLKMC